MQNRHHSMRPLILVGALATFAAPAARAQRPASDTTLLGPGVAPFLALSVADLGREVSWYRDTLGFSVYSQGHLTNRIDYALLREGDVLLELLQVLGSQPRSQAAPDASDPSAIRGFFKGGMIVADVERLYRALQTRGARFLFPLSRPPHGPYRAFGLIDPEGNVLQFFGV